MRNVVPALLIVAAAAAATGTARAAETAWKDFVSQDGRFSVQFPGTPKAVSQTMPTKLGNLDAKVFMLESREGFFMVAYIDYPKEALARSRPDDLLDGAREGALMNVKGKL